MEGTEQTENQEKRSSERQFVPVISLMYCRCANLPGAMFDFKRDGSKMAAETYYRTILK